MKRVVNGLGVSITSSFIILSSFLLKPQIPNLKEDCLEDLPGSLHTYLLFKGGFYLKPKYSCNKLYMCRRGPPGAGTIP